MKILRREYTAEFKMQAVKRVNKRPEDCPGTARELGVVEQTLHNWVKAAREGKLTPGIRHDLLNEPEGKLLG